MKKIWAEHSWDEYVYWQEQDRKTLRKINKLILSVERDGALGGEGKPEPLKGKYSGWYSRRIDDKNRLIYRVEGENIIIASCRAHYDDK